MTPLILIQLGVSLLVGVLLFVSRRKEKNLSFMAAEGWIALTASLIGALLTAVTGTAKPFAVSLFLAIAACLLLGSGIFIYPFCEEAVTAVLERTFHYRGDYWPYFTYRCEGRQFFCQGSFTKLSSREREEFVPGRQYDIYVWPRFPGLYVTKRRPCFWDIVLLIGGLFFTLIAVGVWLWG